MNEPRQEESLRPIRASDLVVELNAMRRKLRPEFRVVPDALSYIIVCLDHLLMGMHDSDDTEH